MKQLILFLFALANTYLASYAGFHFGVWAGFFTATGVTVILIIYAETHKALAKGK